MRGLRARHQWRRRSGHGDTTNIARHLAGFTGASLTAGLALGTTATTASVVSFLANGCAVGGAINAFVHGGNTFALGAGVASVLGNTDNRSLTLRAPQSTIKLLVDPANGDDGLRITYATEGAPVFPTVAPNTINGSRANSVAAGVFGATIGGGGVVDPVGGSFPNQVNQQHGTVSGGRSNSVTGAFGVVGGGLSNTAGSGSNSVSGQTVGGGAENVASGSRSTVPGGAENRAAGDYSFAAGRRAKADHIGAFVWGDNTAADVLSTGTDQFVIRAKGGIRLPGAGENQPGNAAKASGTNMFTHVVPTSGPCESTGVASQRTGIDHPLTNGKPDAILVVTSLGSVTGGASVFPEPVAVYYEPTAQPGGCPTNRWVIFSLGSTTMTAGQRFNVFVINP